MVRSPSQSVNRSRPVDFTRTGLRSGATRAKQALHGARATRLRQALTHPQPRHAPRKRQTARCHRTQSRGMPSGCSQPDSPST
jgi:hypothetical protein